MKPHFKIPALFAGALTALLVVLGIWPVLAQGLPVRSPSTEVFQQPQPGSIAAPNFYDDDIFFIPAAAFGPDGVSPDSYQFVFDLGPLFNGGGGYITGNTRGQGCMQAPAYLPEGVNIQRVITTYYDNDPARQVAARLFRAHRSTGVIQELAGMSSGVSFAANSIISDEDISIDDPLIDNLNYQYYVTVCLPSSQTAFFGMGIGLTTNDMAIDIRTSPAILGPGTTSFTYLYHVMNLGNTNMVGVTLNALLPSETTIIDTNPSSCSHAASQVTCNLGTMSSGSEVVVRVEVDLPDGFTGMLITQATVTSLTGDDVPLNNVDTSILILGLPPIILPLMY
jgi:hypothetical protein